MRAALARTVLLLLPVALGCGGGDPPVDPEIPVLTTVDITRDTATLFTTPPGTSVTLVALGRDQDGVEMPGLAPAEFTSGNEAVATVTLTGTVTAVSPGDALITASMVQGDVARSATATVTVKVPPIVAAVRTSGRRFVPEVVDIAQGGDVSWTIGDTIHDVVFRSQNAPENVQPTSNVTVTRTFPTAGAFGYHCLIHQGMVGSVQVH